MRQHLGDRYPFGLALDRLHYLLRCHGELLLFSGSSCGSGVDRDESHLTIANYHDPVLVQCLIWLMSDSVTRLALFVEEVTAHANCR
jgi:hypothetical protein